MDARIFLVSSLLFVFGEGTTTGADPDSEVRIFLLLTGQIQGEIIGEVTLPGASKKDAIEVVEVRDKVFTPIDQASGLPTGQRRYEGVVLRKPVDRATPLIAHALATHESLTNAELRVFMEDPTDGGLVHRFTYQLGNASISMIEREMFGMPGTSTGLVARPEEEITIRFQSITIRDEVNFVEFTDSIGGGTAVAPVGGEPDSVVLAPEEVTSTEAN
jgi:type VI secretion system secreted protein Hcp